MKTKFLLISAICLSLFSCKKEIEPQLKAPTVPTTKITNKPNTKNVLAGNCYVGGYLIYKGYGEFIHSNSGVHYTNPQDFPEYALALTYDDGPDTYSNTLANWLASQKVFATFFVVRNYSGSSTPASVHIEVLPPFSGFDNLPNLGNYINYGHRVGNHTENHVWLCGEGNYQAQIDNCQTGINAQIGTGKHFYYFREPWVGDAWPGNLPSVAGNTTQNYYAIDGNIAGLDWQLDPDGHVKTATERAAYICDEVVNQNKRGIIVLHDRNSLKDSNDSFPLLHSRYAYNCARSFVPTLKSAGYVFVAPVLNFSPNQTLTNEFSDGSDGGIWYNNIGYYGTFRLVDVNEDGRSDIVARGTDGIYRTLANGNGFSPKTPWCLNNFTDLQGWLPEKYSTTIQIADVDGDGDMDIIGRGPTGIAGETGIMVAINNGGSFSPAVKWSISNDFADNDVINWGSDIGYYGTIRVADVNNDGRADIIGRGSAGIYVATAKTNGTGFNQKTLWTNSFSDAGGWKPAQYSTTIQLADVTNDGKRDLIGRWKTGIVYAANSGTGFSSSSSPLSTSIDFSDYDEVWGSDPTYYRTLRFADVNGDGQVDVCGRTINGIVVAFGTFNNSSMRKFLNKRLWTPNSFDNTNSWNIPQYSFTLQFGDIDGDHRADIIGRSSWGFVGGFAP